MPTLHLKQSIGRSPLRLGFLLFPLTLGCFALSPTARAVAPALPGECPPNFTTAGGCHALYDLTTGVGNTGMGWHALAENTDASFSTGIGAGALFDNNGSFNTAVGAAALFLNTTGSPNTAVGTSALGSNDSGSLNTAVGNQALLSNVSGLENTAMGDQALLNNVGSFNVAVGGAALITNTGGNDNTACGSGALNDTTGSDNTALGFQAGILATDGDGNVYIGAGMSGVAGESNQTYIRNINTTSVSGAGTDTVTVNLSTGLLGHVSSSRRYKDDIKTMDNASETLFALKPVTFRYKKEIDQSQTLDYGLIAEEVAKVDSNLAIRDKNGQIESVRYSAINAMLLNEFLKEHKAFLEEQRKVQEQGATIARMEQQIEALTAGLQKVSAQFELAEPAPQTVLNSR
jgi:Chaperone of endosialidase